MSRKWRKSKTKNLAVHAVPYGPPLATTVPPHHRSNGTMKGVALVGATIAAPYILRGIFKLLSKR